MTGLQLMAVFENIPLNKIAWDVPRNVFFYNFGDGN